MSCIAVIPARYRSTRLPGKPLLDIAGKPMIQHVYERVRLSRLVERVIVATDDERILEAVRAFGGEAVLTSPLCSSGSDRVAEVASKLTADLVVNVQGDEPLISPETIDSVASCMLGERIAVASTAKVRLRSIEDLLDPNNVKVVTDAQGYALYFSRSPIPFRRAEDEDPIGANPQLLGPHYKHLGVYAYRAPFLSRFAAMPPTPLEICERLEQLRILENGYRIKVVEVQEDSIGVDTPEDLERVRLILARTQVGADTGQPG